MMNVSEATGTSTAESQATMAESQSETRFSEAKAELMEAKGEGSDDVPDEEIAAAAAAAEAASEGSSSSSDKKRSADEAEISSEEDEDYELDQNRFPDKVRYLLDERVAPEAIWWLPEGDALAVNKDAFSMQLLIRHFRGNKFSSVTRNFNRWGFRRVPEERVPEGVLGYAHDMFKRDRIGLLKKMKKEVYIKKEKDSKEDAEGKDTKKRPKKKQRTKKARAKPSSPVTEAGAGMAFGGAGLHAGQGMGAVGRGSPDLHVRLHNQLLSELSASSATAAVSRPGGDHMHDRFLSQLAATSAARPGAAITGWPGSLPRPGSGSALAAGPSHLSSIERILEQQNQAADALAAARAAELAQNPFASLALARRAAERDALLASRLDRQAVQEAGLSSLLPHQALAGSRHQSSALQQLMAGSTATASTASTFGLEQRTNQDVLQQIARQRQLEAALGLTARPSREDPPATSAAAAAAATPSPATTNPADAQLLEMLSSRGLASQPAHRTSAAPNLDDRLMAAAAARRQATDTALLRAAAAAPATTPSSLIAAAPYSATHLLSRVAGRTRNIDAEVARLQLQREQQEQQQQQRQHLVSSPQEESLQQQLLQQSGMGLGRGGGGRGLDAAQRVLMGIREDPQEEEETKR